MRHFEAGLPVHVIHRGNNRQDIFHCEDDRRKLWQSLVYASSRFNVAVNAYVFMTNHVHLLLTPEDETSISRMMHWTAWSYTEYFNDRYGRTGALWGGRFRSSNVTEERYFFACHRYIDLNPVRAGIVQHPSDYAWSSHRHYAFGDADLLIRPHEALLELGIDDAGRRRAYGSLFRHELDSETLEAIRSSLNSGCPIGQKVRRGPPFKPKFVPGTNAGLFVPGTIRPADT